MTKDDEREVRRKLRILPHAEKVGHVAKTCRYHGIKLSDATIYRHRGAIPKDSRIVLVEKSCVLMGIRPGHSYPDRIPFIFAGMGRAATMKGNIDPSLLR